MKKILYLATFVVSPLFSVIHAAPFAPEADDVVVSTSYAAINFEYSAHIKQLRALNKAEPDNLSTAVSLANSYIKLAREKDDPRYFGLAENVIRPWWDDTRSISVQLAKALILQFSHQFEVSNIVLSRVLQKNPGNAQALLLRANNFLTSGEYNQAYQDCVSLTMLTSPSISAACVVAIKGLRLDHKEAIALVTRLSNLMAMDKSLSATDKQWITGIMVEVLIFHEALEQAEIFLKQASYEDYANEYLTVTYADLLLKMSRYDEVVDLLAGEKQSIAILTRLVIAERQLNHKNFVKNKNSLEVLFKEEALRGEVMHFREKAMFEYSINNSLEKALYYAKQNWINQRGIGDALLLHRYATKVNDVVALDNLHQWQVKNQINVDL